MCQTPARPRAGIATGAPAVPGWCWIVPRADLDGHDGVVASGALVSDTEVSSLIASVGRGIAWGAAATTAAVTTVVVTTGVVIYHSVEATKAAIGANQADRDLAKAQDKLNQILINKKKQSRGQEQKTEPEAQTATGGAGQRTGGGRNEKKSNQNRQQSAKDKLADLKQQRDALDRKTNKTPEDKAQIDKLKKAINREIDRARDSETHSRKQKGHQQ